MATKNILAVKATADRHGNTWICEAADPHHPNTAGLFAWGDTFTAARAGLAAMILAAGVPAGTDAIRIFAMTRKTFRVADLDAG